MACVDPVCTPKCLTCIVVGSSSEWQAIVFKYVRQLAALPALKAYQEQVEVSARRGDEGAGRQK